MSDSGNDCAKLHSAAHQLCGGPMATSPSLRRRTSVCSFLNRLLKLRPVRLFKDLGLHRSGATPRLGVHSTFDGSMILFENVVQVLHRSVSTAVAQRPFLLSVGDRGAVYRRQISVDHSRLGIGSIAERLAKQSLGSIGVTQR